MRIGIRRIQHVARSAVRAVLVEYRARALLALAVVGIAVGGALDLVVSERAGHGAWRAVIVVIAAELAWQVARTAVARRNLGVDAIALIAMIGALALGEDLAGAVVGLMFSGGQALEAAASRRARRELTALVQRVPRDAWRRAATGIERVPVALVGAGDVVVVRTGEVVPVDGILVSDEAVVDTSALTGESLPLVLPKGAEILSGWANSGSPFGSALSARRETARTRPS